MNIRILQGIDGARKAIGLTVIIDVFRAFTVEAYMTHNRASKIIPVGDVQTAFDYKNQHPEAVLCGERGGVMVDGFDFGNSPAQIEEVDFTGKTVIHTTSAGTQGIASAACAGEILAGNLVCAAAIARYIRGKNPAEVSLAAMGLSGSRPTEEDTLAAEYIRSLLEERPLPDLQARIARLQETDGAKFFKPEMQHIFPRRDFELCVRVSEFPFVLRLTADPAGGPAYMERVDITQF